MQGARRKTRNEALGGALRALVCCTVMACSEASIVATPPSAGSGGSGGVSGNSGSGSAGAAAGSSGAGGGRAEQLDASTDAVDAMPFCCTPSPQPDCCMFYGGRRRGDDTFACGPICDGIPLPNAAWQLGVDGDGCPVWIEPPQTNQCCGCAPEDGGI
ncbi:MAG: hypothetical protein ABI895_22365 [Deltaproteobacteria bacterium]